MSPRLPARFASLLFCSWAGFAQAGLQDYPALVVADQNPKSAPPRSSIRVTYLGGNGYQFETGDCTLLVDPYFSRVEFWPVTFKQAIAPNQKRIDDAMANLRHRPDAILVTHAHFDHLLDVPEIMRRTGARLFAGRSAINLVRSFEVRSSQCDSVVPGSRRRIDAFTVHVLPAQHDHVLGSLPFAGQVDSIPKQPVTAADWKLGEPLAFVIEAAGKRIYVDSGGVPGQVPKLRGKMDLAILGAALADSRRRLPETIRQLQPRFVLPSHQDNFFAPASRGFEFGNLTNFPEVVRMQQSEQLPGRLVLLDYYRPWTLP